MGHSSSGGHRDRNNNRGRSRSRRPEPEPSLGQKILGFFGLGSKPEPRTSRDSRPDRRDGGGDKRKSSSSSGKPRERRAPQKVEVTSGRLYVGNLNYDTTDSDLSDYFGEVGSVVSAEVVRNPHNDRSKGFGFVEMESIDDAKKAVDQYDGEELAGRKLIVNGAKADTRNDRSSSSSSSSRGGDRDSSSSSSPSRESGRSPRERRPRRDREERGGRGREDREERGSDRVQKRNVATVSSANLEITNVNKVLTEEDLVDFFRGIGTMTECEIVKNDDGETTGANIVMTNNAEAQRAVEIMDGKTFMGQQIKISERKGDAAETAEAPAAEETPAVSEEPAAAEADSEEKED